MRKLYKFSYKIFKEFFLLQKFYGFTPAFYTFVWWINFYIKTPLRFKLSKWALEHKTKWLTNFIEKKYPSIIQKYISSQSERPIIEAPTIWVFWGQGENAMPKLVKACYIQLCKHNKKVILITNENLTCFITINPLIIKKVTQGLIPWANFSDIIRSKLLYQYGGLWLDATVWCPSEIPIKRLLSFPLFSPNSIIKHTNKSICFWTSYKYNWSTWCLWSNHSESNLFGFLSEMMENIAINENLWPDYVFQDYLIYYAINNIPGVKDEFDKFKSLSGNNRNQLAMIMGSPYDEKEYQKLCKTDFVFKLSFRTLWGEKTEAGETTYYGKLIKGL